MPQKILQANFTLNINSLYFYLKPPANQAKIHLWSHPALFCNYFIIFQPKRSPNLYARLNLSVWKCFLFLNNIFIANQSLLVSRSEFWAVLPFGFCFLCFVFTKDENFWFKLFQVWFLLKLFLTKLQLFILKSQIINSNFKTFELFNIKNWFFNIQISFLSHQ